MSENENTETQADIAADMRRGMIKSTREPGFPKCQRCGGTAVLRELCSGWRVACENWFPVKDGRPHNATVIYDTNSEAISAWMRQCNGKTVEVTK